jgi:hypothetical protein
MKKISILSMSLLAMNLSATTIYLSPSGSDTDDGSIATPVKTICKALSIAQTNDVIKVSGFINLSEEPSKAETNRGNINLNGTSVYTTEDGITYNTWNPVVTNGSFTGKVGIMVLNKRLTIEGTDPETDGFDGNQSSTLFRMDGCGNGLTFKNLTFKNGNNAPYGDSGAGLYIRSTTASFENCIFTNNKNTSTSAGGNGGAISVIASNAIFTGCRFTENYNRYGAAFHAAVTNSNSLTIEECIFENHNTTDNNGSRGVLYLTTSGASGAGSQILVRSSYFLNNQTSAGGALFIDGSVADATLNILIESCAFNGNRAALYGGGAIYMNAVGSNKNVTVANSTIYNNSLAGGEGSALVVQNGTAGNSLNLTNCTITGNKSGNNTNGAIRFPATAVMTKGIYNCIIEGNSNTANAYMDATWPTGAEANLSIHNSFIGAVAGTNVDETHYPGNFIGYYASESSKAGLGAYDTEKHYFSLLENSPAIAFGDAKYLRDDLDIITDQLGQVRTFIDNKCAIGSYEVSIKPDGFADTYQHFLLYGQSHSEGAGSYPALSVTNVEGNYMLGPNVWSSKQVSLAARSNFQPMVARDIPAAEGTIVYHRQGENPVVGLVNHIQNKTKGTGDESRMLGTSSGVGGQIIEQLNKGSVLANHYNNNILDVLNKVKTIAKPKKIKMLAPAIFWMQGESNSQTNTDPPRVTTTNEYKALLVALKNDMQNDIMTIYENQETKPVFITYQMSGMFTGNFRELPIARAHVEIAEEEEDIICAGPLYPVTHHTVNDTHLDANGYRWYGEMFGKVYYKTQILKEEFKPLQPIAFSATSNPKEVKIHFHVPVPPLAFDDKMLAKIPNYGFEIYFEGTASRKTIVNERIEDDCVILTLAENLPSSGNIEVMYAGQNYRFGNLRDSDPYQAFYTYKDLDEKDENDQYLYPRENSDNGQPKLLRPVDEPKNAEGNVIYGQPYPLYNFCVAFYQKIGINELLAGSSSTNNIPEKDKKPTVFVYGANLVVNQGNASIEKIDIINLAGKTIKTIDGTITTGIYPLETLPQGAYIIRTITSSGNYTTKGIR